MWNWYFLNQRFPDQHMICGLCAQLFSCIQLFAATWTVVCQVPLPMELSKQEYWSGLLFPTSGDLPDPGIESESFVSPALAGGLFTTTPQPIKHRAKLDTLVTCLTAGSQALCDCGMTWNYTKQQQQSGHPDATSLLIPELISQEYYFSNTIYMLPPIHNETGEGRNALVERAKECELPIRSLGFPPQCVYINTW